MKTICDVVVLAWNKLEVTKQFVEGLLLHTSLPTRVILIDNNSQDGTKEYLSSLKDSENCHFHIVFNDENVGFVRGVNQGLKLSTAPFVCLANNDLIFTKGWLEEAVNVFEKHPLFGALNPNSNNLNAAPPSGVSIDAFAAQLQERHNGECAELPFCIGFCLILRREVIEKVGYLSEEFIPMFFEDTDYSMRIQKAGYRLGKASASYVWHQEHASIDQLDQAKKEEYFQRSRSVFTKKWGKILRVAIIVRDEKELLDRLSDGLAICRNGNFAWFYVKNLKMSCEAIYKEKNELVHGGLKFIKHSFMLGLIGRIILKKKKHDVIVTENKVAKLLLQIFGYKVLDKQNISKIDKIKYNARKTN